MLSIKSLVNGNIYSLEGFKFSLGSADECDIVISDSMLRDVHALLWVGNDFLTVMTVQDAVVTVNGELITDRVIVKIGDKISFADHEMQVVKESVNVKKPAATEKTSDWMLISRNQEMKGKKFVIDKRCTIGRAKDNTICIPVISLSRHHATLTIDEGGLKVEDQQSANGTFVNGNQLGGTPFALNRGDVVAFDELEFLVHGPDKNIFSDQTSVRSIRQPSYAMKSAGPTAIDRQKISIVQHKPESFTQRFKAIQAEQAASDDLKGILKHPAFWLVIAAVSIAIIVLLVSLM